MKINRTVATVETNISYDQTTSMTVDQKNISHIMKMVTDMYQKPYAAIPREYISNAIDSHIKAGQTRPVEVSLPSAFSQNFIVRDYGVGMSRAELTDIYSKYGSSTKNLANDEIGGFGLGAKSALALVSQFTVKSVQDGLQNVVVIAKDETGVGALNFLEETATDAPNGVTITIPMPNVRELLSAIENDSIFLGWEKGSILVDGKEPVANVNNPDYYTSIADGVWVKNEALKADPNGAIPRRGHYYSPTFTVLVGPVAYCVSEQDSGFSFRTTTGVEGSAVVSLPIGSVDFTPSRDNFIFTRRTREAITEAFGRVQPAYLKTIEQRFVGMTDAAEVFKIATAIRQYIRVFGTSATIPLMWNDEEIPEFLTGVKGDAFSAFAKATAPTVITGNTNHGHETGNITFVHSADMAEENLKSLNGMRLEFRRAFPSVYFEEDTSRIVFTARKEADLSKWEKVFARKIVSAEDFLDIAVKNRRDRTAALRAQAKAEAAAAGPQAVVDKITKIKEGLMLRVVVQNEAGTRVSTDEISATTTDVSDKIVLIRTGKGAENTLGDHAYQSIRDSYSNRGATSTVALVMNHFKDQNVRVVLLPAAQKGEKIYTLFTDVVSFEDALDEAVAALLTDPAKMYMLAMAFSNTNDHWPTAIFAQGSAWDGYSLNEEFLSRVENKEVVDFIKVAVTDQSSRQLAYLANSARTFSEKDSESKRYVSKIVSPAMTTLNKAILGTKVQSFPLLTATVPRPNESGYDEFVTDAIEYINKKSRAV